MIIGKLKISFVVLNIAYRMASLIFSQVLPFSYNEIQKIVYKVTLAWGKIPSK